ncbi:MAG: hypothetical protein LBQ68_05750 [Clostridiales bacterium]|jgi:bifunctional UDP-N-acetylglucosamine pyrophosphorylase/glucosamine-1-phosphate N-acetyltransferase|nr:hypothetical protein [Clostridiales bacterium]
MENRLEQVKRLINNKEANERLIESGVIMLDPNSVWIDDRARIEPGVILYPGVIIEGECKIGKDCIIGPNSRLVNSEIGEGTEVAYSVLLDCTVGAFTNVGPFAYIRPHSKVGDHCKIGDFVEIKNSVLGDGTKASHLTYVGDSDVGKKVNFGCGTVTVNYDGTKKYRTVIEDNVFIGCNSNLVAPVVLKEGAYTAAGSTITDDVPAHSLGIARARQVNKEGWSKKL